MKKITLILVAMTMSLFSFAAQPKRIYAYDLSSTLVDKVYTFSFTANETPTSGKIIFYDATSSELVGEIALTNPVLGKNEVEIAEYSLPGNDGQQLNWSVELSAAEVTAFEAVYTGTKKFGRGHATIDNSPESDYFGRVYVTDRRTSNSKSGLYVYTPDLQLINNTVYALGRDESGYARPAVAADGTLFLADYTDDRRSGIWVVNPSDLTTCTQFYNGTRASSGLFTNAAGKEIGSSTSGVGIYGSGANTVLYTMMEDGTNASSAVCYHIGQLDGSILKTWSDVPTWICTAYASINPSTNNAFAATEKGVWVSQNDGTTGRKELAFIDNTGVLQYSIDNGKCEGAGLAVNSDNSKLFICGSTSILEYDVVWDGKTPAPALKQTHTISDRYVSTLSFDYAGNLLACTGASYSGTDSDVMRLIQYTIPTDNNTCEVPAKKAYIVTKKEADVTLYTVTTQVVGEGSITGNLGTYEAGASAELTAVANEHYDFVNWTGDVTSTDNPLIITVNGDKNITANFAKKQYTLTVSVNDGTKGSVNPTSGTYAAESEVQITAVANPGYEFTNWSNGSKTNPLTISMEEDTELTANFRAILPSSITLNAHPVKDYSASIVGTMKRAIQYGENTIVLTHEDNGTPHIYNIAHTTKTVTEISQEGVVAVDPDNAGDFLAISDIALTADGKLVACNYMLCQNTASYVDAGYKRGTTRFYIWNEIDGDPTLWFTSQQSVNYYRARVGYTMALKGTSDDAWVIVAGFNNNATGPARFDHYHLVNGSKSTTSPSKAANMSYSAIGSTYEISASPLADGNWVLDGELAVPTEFVESKDNQEMTIFTPIAESVLDKKYNGATYLANYNDHHLMIAPYAGADGKLAGVKVLGISDGFDAATLVTTATDLTNPIDATSAAATTYVDGDGDLTIYLIADGKVYPFSEKVYTAQTFTVTASAGEGGSVEGGGLYEESSTATVTASPAEHYDFVSWTEDGAVVSTTAEYSFTVTKDIELTANFQEHAKYTITAVANDENMGTVTGGREYYVGESATLKATAKSGYVFAGWEDGEKNATRTVTVSGNATYTANFQAIAPRAWAYDLKVVEDGDNYKFTFNTTAAGTATLLFADIDGNPVAPTSYDVGPVAVGANTVLVAKASFTENKDVYWSVKMDGEAIPAISEITDQSRGIYDFYNMMGVVVDNNTDSKDFGKIYIQQSYERSYASSSTSNNGITTRANDQKSGVFIYNQELDELNSPSNVGYKPTMPTGYTAIGASRESFKRLAINPTNGNLVFGNNISGEGSVWSIGRDNLTAEATNIIEGATGIDKVNAICYDENGSLYVLANITTGSEKYNLYKFTDGEQTELTLEGKKIFVDSDVAMTSDGRGGLWIAQRRGAITQYSILSHINVAEDNVDFVLDAEGTYKDWFAGNCFRAAIAYNAAESIVAVQGASKILLFKVSYDALTGAPSISKYLQVSPVGNSVDGLAFDYAGDLYTVNSGSEKFQKFTLPTADNICTVPAPESQVIKKEIRYIVTVNVEGNGEVEGVGEYVAGAEAKLKAIPSLNNEFVSWTLEDASTSTDNPLTLTVNSNITITANFKKVSRSLILGTNDEAKGTVSGAGTYDHGTEVEITATPKAGYKLLYWSDRSTENPRTITMTKNEAISAYFVKEYTEEPTFKIEKLWENTNVPASTNNGYQAVGWDQKIYMKDRLGAAINVYTETGSELYAQLGATVTDLGGDQPIAVDNAGNLIVRSGSGEFHTSPVQVTILKKGETTGKTIDFTLPATGRCDFISASGDIYSEEGGYVYFYCQNQTTVSRLFIKNGGATSEDISVDEVGATLTEGSSQSHVFTNIFGDLMTHTRASVKVLQEVNASTGVATTMNLPNFKESTLGGCSFELGGKEFIAYNIAGTDYNSEWNLYNMTDGEFLSNETLYAKDKVSKKTYGAANWLNVQVVDENTAYIYQFCPEVAVAMWKVSINRTDLQEFTVTATANNPAMGIVTGEGTYYEDATATLTATPHAGYRFVNWTKAGVEVSTNATYTFTVTEDVELVANFEALPEIVYELNGGVWNKYGWTSKKDMYNAFIADWKAYSGSTRGTIPYEDQFGIGKSNAGIPTTIQDSEPILDFMTQSKWGWLAKFLDALAEEQNKGTKPSEATRQMRYALGNFFGEDNNGASNWIGAVDCSGDIASLSAFSPYWGQTFPMPTQPTEEIVLNAPYKEGYEFSGWYTTSDFSGAAVTTVDENTDGTLYAKWIETIITVTIDENAGNTTILAPYDDKTVTATVTRNFGANKILTVTLPFDMSASQISTHFGNATVYEFYNVVDAGEELHLQFAHTNSIEAGKPYILQTTTSEYDAEDGFIIENVTINTELTQVKIGDLTMVPVLDGGGTLNQPTQYYLSNNALYCAGDYERPLPGLRAFFTSASSTPIRARVIFDDNGATSIPTVIAPETKAQKIIKDGRLIIIRGEHQYNAQGQMIE